MLKLKSDTKILVLGFGVTGISVVKYLLYQGYTNIVINGNGTLNEQTKQMFIKENVTVVEQGQDKLDLKTLNVELIIKSPGIKTNQFLENAITLQIPIWTDIELVYNTKKLNYIAISGTNGKTTTTTIIYKILKKLIKNKDVHLCGNIGIPICDVAITANDNDWLVCELSSFQLEYTHKFTPNIYAITNITKAHLDHHRTLENYEKSKLDLLKRGTDKQTVLYFEDTQTKILNANPKYKLIKLNSSDENTIVHLKDDKLFLNGEFLINTKQLPLVGEHNIKNYIQAIETVNQVVDVKMSQDTLKEILKTPINLEHRLEFLGIINNQSIYNDAKSTNVDSLKTALKSFDCRLTLICGGFDRKEDYTQLKDDLTNITQTFIIGQNAKKMAKTMPNPTICNSLSDAAHLALKNNHKSEVILFSPGAASYDQFDNYIQRGNAFKEIIKGCLIN